MTDSPVVAATGLTFGYRGRAVLSSVDFAAYPGRVVSLVGANGAGKTTLLRCLTGLLEPQGGDIRVAGRPLAGLSRRELAEVMAFVPQSEPSRFPMTVFDAVLLGRRPYLGWRPRDRDLETVAHTLERMGLSDLALRHLNQLSGGERQKVAIAKAIAQEPRVLLLDEPTTYLDLKHQVMVLDILESLARDGVAIVMSIHDLNLAFRVSAEVVALHDAEVLACGPPATITNEVIRSVYGVDCDVVEVSPGQLVVVPRR